MNTNSKWLASLSDVMQWGQDVSPRGQNVKEIIGYSYNIDMNDPSITLKDRNMNYGFMYGEASWIVSGSNWLQDISKHMKRYADFSDDQVFLNGAYGPKVVEQLAYVVSAIEKDIDTRQAVMSIWRERPASSKDIPCTLTFQFFVRNDALCAVVNMRSQDAVWGVSYDLFTFTMVANMVRCLLLKRGIKVSMGSLTVNVGSFHIYDRHFDDVSKWLDSNEIDPRANKVQIFNKNLLLGPYEPHELIAELNRYSQEFK